MASRRPAAARPGEVARVVVAPATRVHVFCQDAVGAARIARFSLRSALGHTVPIPGLSVFSHERAQRVLVPGSYTLRATTLEGTVVTQDVRIRDMDVGNWIVVEIP
jgi:hypothetical protein